MKNLTFHFDSTLEPSADDWAIGIAANRVLIDEAGSILHKYSRLTALNQPMRCYHSMGNYQGKACFFVLFDTDQDIQQQTGQFDGLEWVHLRTQLGILDEGLFGIGGRALQLAHWVDHHRFCGHCGAKTRVAEKEPAMICNDCGTLAFPRISPCVIGIITRQEYCLLAHNTRFPEGVYSVLAGFIEPGESAENALAREVMEEVSLQIKNIRYVESQSWPFPSQLMLGFVAEYASGDICVDGYEIGHAEWFRYDQLPTIPPPETISGKLIQLFVDQQRRLAE